MNLVVGMYLQIFEGVYNTMMLVNEQRDVSLWALKLIVGMYLQPFEVFITYNIKRVYNIGIYNIDTYNHRRYII